MISRLKLWQKIFVITAVLGIPLLIVTREYVDLVKELSLNNLNDQLAALPAIEHIGDLTRLIQDYGANLPLWVIGSNITATEMEGSSRRISELTDEVAVDLSHLKHNDRSQWESLNKTIKDFYAGGADRPRGFTAYTDLSSRLTNYAEVLSYSYKFYSGAGNLFVPSRLAVDLTPSLAENINLLRGFVTYKIFVGERALSDLSTASSYLSLAENRFQEIKQSLGDLKIHNPELFKQLQPSLSKIELQMTAVREMVELYVGDNFAAVQPEIFFAHSTELIGSIYELHNLSIRVIAAKLGSEIRLADQRLNIIIGSAVFAGILVLALIFFISRSFVRGVRDIAKISEQVAAGDRQIRFPPEDSNIEIRSIMGEIRRIYVAICASEEKSRIDNWLLERQKALNEMIQGENDIELFAKNCVASLCASIGADCASFYHVDQGDLDLIFSQGAAAPRHVAQGSKLISRVSQLGQIRNFSRDELPTDFTVMDEKRGQRRPEGLIIFPIRLRREVVAVLEFASTHTFEEVSAKFLEAVEENIAVLLKSLLANIRVVELLDKTQQQSEDLREANGEMAVKSLLLNEQQLVLQQVNQELEEQRSELEAQNEKLEVVVENLALAKMEAEAKGREAEVANRYKSIFLANMSHELRTPLNSIMILAQVLAENREKAMTENQIKNAKIIHTSGKDLLKLINEILDLSRIEAGKIEISSVRIEVLHFADETREMYDALARNKQLDYSVIVDEDCPQTIETDPIRLAQIVRNFVANAIKFTEVGQVGVAFLKPVNPLFELQIDIFDTGVGIPEDKRAEIFEPFRQLDNTLSRKQEGTGLGLAISKNLAAKLGGVIEVTSETGKGSTFSILLPKHIPVEEGEETLRLTKPFIEDDRDLIANGEATLLVIEDDGPFAELLLSRCRAEGFRCVVSMSGADCVPFAERFKPHGIILDIKLPDVDGLDVLTALKANPKTRHIPVHVFSGTDGEIEAMRRGAAEFVPKPISIERLDQVLRTMPQEAFFEDISLFLHSVDSKMAKAKLPRPKVPISENQFEGKTILIVDDDIRNVYSLRQILHGRGCSIVIATNGREALEVLEVQADISLVLMDIMMPEMDGYEAMRRIRLMARWQNLPIIALTAKAMKDDRDLCLEAGANDYLLKPIDTDKLIMLLRVWLGT